MQSALRRRALNESIAGSNIFTTKPPVMCDLPQSMDTANTTAQQHLQREQLPTNRTQRSLSESSADEYQHSKNGATSGGSTLAVNGSSGNSLNKRLSAMRPPSKESLTRPQSPLGGRKKGAMSLSTVVDIVIRIALVVAFIRMEVTQAFKRKIHMEELWLYQNPRQPDIVSPQSLIIAVIFAPFLVTLGHRLLTGDRRDYAAANWTWTLILCLNGLCTSLLKITVGRPRPDFFYRCFPDGVMVLSNFTAASNGGDFDLLNCTGVASVINEGRKSFPSGHSSFAFASFGFLAFYFAGKLHAFNQHGRHQSWRLCISVTPLIVALLVAVSRYCDYHHHWQDVVCGAVIGLAVAHLVYRQYYPSLFSNYCHRPHSRRSSSFPEGGLLRQNAFCPGQLDRQNGGDVLGGEKMSKEYEESDENRPLIENGSPKRNNKWI